MLECSTGSRLRAPGQKAGTGATRRTRWTSRAACTPCWASSARWRSCAESLHHVNGTNSNIVGALKRAMAAATWELKKFQKAELTVVLYCAATVTVAKRVSREAFAKKNGRRRNSPTPRAFKLTPR